jgi:hypothetical protein
MTEPVIKMVGLANDDRPNAVADIFADQMQDRIADHVTAAKDVISNNLFGTEMPDEQVDAELEDNVDVPDVEYEDAEEVEDDQSDDYEADQEVIEEPAEDEEPSSEEEEN